MANPATKRCLCRLHLHLDSRSADSLHMKPMLGEAPAGTECDRISPQFVLCLSGFALCSLHWFAIDCQTNLRPQAAVGTCGIVRAEGGENLSPPSSSAQTCAEQNCSTKAAAQGLQSPTWQHNLGCGSLENERGVGGLFPESILLPAGV